MSFRLAELRSAFKQSILKCRTFADCSSSVVYAFSGAPQGPFAPPALLALAGSLAALGQTPQACLTLTEVATRFPGSEAAAAAPGRRAALGCQ